MRESQKFSSVGGPSELANLPCFPANCPLYGRCDEPPIWQLVRDAIQHFNREVSYSELKQFVWAQYPDVNNSTLTCQIIICSVNHPSRIHYPENKKPRVCNSQYDFLYHTGRGRVMPYDPEQHGLWEISASLTTSNSVCISSSRSAASSPSKESNSRRDRVGRWHVTKRDCTGRIMLYRRSKGD